MTRSPHITLLLGPTACGKTETALDLLHEARAGRALLLVPDSLQRRRLQSRLHATARVRVHQFYSLTEHFLQRAGSDTRALNATLRTMLLRTILLDLAAAGRLPVFARVAPRPGFVALVGAFISEAQDAGVSPEALATAGVTPYDAELGAIYAAYRAALERLKLADRARRLALTREIIYTNPRLLAGIDLFVVDGFDQFTPLQLSLLAEMTRQIERSVITLTGGSAQRPAQRRFIRTRDQVIATLQPTEIRTLDTGPWLAERRAPALVFIEQHLFNLDAPPPMPAGGALVHIAAADREREVRAALRRVRALLNGGSAPEQVALLYRTGDAYVPLLREVAAEYDLPLAIYEGLPLAEAPPVVTFLKMLRLPLTDYPRRELVEVWRNSGQGLLELATPEAPVDDPPHPLPEHQALMLTPERAAGLLDRAGRQAGVSGGLARLRAALADLAAAAPVIPDDELPVTTIDPANAAALLELLDAFVTWLTPPPQAAMHEYVDWARERMHLDDRPQTSADPPLPADEAVIPDPESEIQHDPPRDAVQQRLSAVLDELAEAATTLNAAPISYSAFVAELSAAVAGARYGRVAPEPGRVAVLPVLAARGVCFDHIVLLGLAEGEFPLKLPDPAFYSRRERTLLAQRGIHLTPPDPADERSLFYETVAHAQRSLTLTRTYLDESGNPLPPSAYVHALLDLVEPGSVSEVRIKAGSVPTLAEAVSPQEAMVAVLERVAHNDTAHPTPSALDPLLLEHVRRACAIEQAREDTGDYGVFEGVVNDPELQARMARHFGPHYRWSVTQLNDYITCPFRFAAAHVLKLAPQTEPAEGLEHAGRGRLYHAILAEAGRQWIQSRHAHTDDNAAAILEILHSAAESVLADAPTRYGFEPGTFWEWERNNVRRRLTRALRRVLKEAKEWTAFRPAGVEQSFGLSEGAPPLTIKTPAGDVRVIGRIDRVDQREDGALALIDYKSAGISHRHEALLDGRDVQLAIYLLAVEQLLAPQQRVERAAFLHLSTGKHSTPLTPDDRERALTAAITRVTEVVQGARSGYFAVRPRDECPRGCAFAQICRLNLAKRNSQL